MKKKSCKYTPRAWIGIGMVMLLLAACSTDYPQSCPNSTPVGLMEADEIASNDELPFRFPLDESAIDQKLFFAWLGISNECPPGKTDCYEYPVLLFHAAEDYDRPAGTPVYAMADGHISFSGPAGGYGWLIIIDHPQANLYSLYGHLSPSRWKQKSGVDVNRGDLIAYLGDSDENGGSAESPVVTHLHFGIRAGQMADYPSKGEWRYMAGWIRLCPQNLGWLQPSRVITSQEIPPGGYQTPRVPFLARWGWELLITGSYGLFGSALLIAAIRKNSRPFLIIPGLLVIAAGIVLHVTKLLSTHILTTIGVLVLGVGVFWYARRTDRKPRDAA